MSIPFTKMHGLGNDIMILDCIRTPAATALLTEAKVRALGDRKTGVGFDQLMVIEPASDPQFAAAYRVFNGDGSSAQQCGNGLRCVAAYLDQHYDHIDKVMTLRSPEGPVDCLVNDDGTVQVGLRAPDFTPAALPFEPLDQPGPVYTLGTASGPVMFSIVSVGNPHAVIQVKEVGSAAVDNIGAELNAHAQFPEGVNVGFAEVVARDHVKLRVFERGVGETRACGSGACAAMVALRRREQIADSVQVDLPGGTLVISWRANDEPVIMTGPVTTVFEGKLTT